MDWGALFFVLAVLILVIWFLSKPFYQGGARLRPLGKPQLGVHPTNINALWDFQERRDQMLGALQDLEYDREAGKIPLEAYTRQRETLLDAGVNVIRQMRMIYPASPKASGATAPGPGASISPRAVRFPHFEEDELEEMINTYRRNRQEKAIGFCPNCWKPIKESDRYCAQCGAPVKAEKLLKNL